MTEQPVSCTQPVRGPLGTPETVPGGSDPAAPREEECMIARVGKPAPDFEAMGYVGGGFKVVKLSDYKDHWLLLCFYPGDFTFV